jgi:site-specific DNA-methyltransferase (adenine-specific)
VGGRTFDVAPFLKLPRRGPSAFHLTALGALYAADCMKVLPLLKDEVIDTVFADPPFNLGKEYGKNTDDSLPDREYIE